MAGLLENTVSNLKHTRLDRPVKKLPKYPHFIPQENQMWSSFLEENPTFFDAATYDVRVGKGQNFQGDFTPSELMNAKILSQKRIDVLAEHNNKIYIVELKFNPTVSIAGQLESYKILLLNDLKEKIEINLVAIMNFIDPDLQTIFSEKTISHFIV